MAMMRGVSCALASCTATSNAEETNTMNVNIAEAMVPNSVRAASGPILASQPNACSPLWSSGTTVSAAIMLSTGRIQIEFVK